MAAGVNVRKLETKSHDKPDEVRTPSKTRVEIFACRSMSASPGIGLEARRGISDRKLVSLARLSAVTTDARSRRRFA
jgi:hypothetical protein